MARRETDPIDPRREMGVFARRRIPKVVETDSPDRLRSPIWCGFHPAVSRRWRDAKLPGGGAHTHSGNCFQISRGYVPARPAKTAPFASDAVETETNAFCDSRPLELGDRAEDVHLKPASGRRRVDTIGEADAYRPIFKSCTFFSPFPIKTLIAPGTICDRNDTSFRSSAVTSVNAAR